MSEEFSPGGYFKSEVYGCEMPLRIEASDNTHTVRKFLQHATGQLATAIMQTWLANPGVYDIDIKLTMEKKS